MDAPGAQPREMYYSYPAQHNTGTTARSSWYTFLGLVGTKLSAGCEALFVEAGLSATRSFLGKTPLPLPLPTSNPPQKGWGVTVRVRSGVWGRSGPTCKVDIDHTAKRFVATGPARSESPVNGRNHDYGGDIYIATTGTVWIHPLVSGLAYRIFPPQPSSPAHHPAVPRADSDVSRDL